jgi:hypothetical protein
MLAEQDGRTSDGAFLATMSSHSTDEATTHAEEKICIGIG